MTNYHRAGKQKRHFSPRWLVLLALVGLMFASLGCSLGERLEQLALPDGPRQTAVAMRQVLATYTPWPTFTPTAVALPSPSPTATWIPWPTPTATEAPVPTATATAIATATFTPLPSATPWPTDTPLPARPTATSIPRIAAAAPSPATPTPAPTPTAGYDYLVNEVFIDRTTNPFLTGYVAIVNAQEIPIGGVKAVGVFEPGGQRHESPLSKWFFDVGTAPGAVAKTGSVKFEPGGIQAGTWFIHLENEGGARLSEDVAINTDPDNPEWFYIKFKQPGSALVSAPTPPASSSTAGVATTGGSAATASSGWSFAGVQSVYNPEWEGVFVYGEAVNNTGSSQQLIYVTGTFYDDQGRVVAGQYDTDDYWPIEVVPPQGIVPFEVALYDVQSVADFDLKVVAQPAGETPRQDFEFLDLDAYAEVGEYCVGGKLRNPGGALRDYLTIAAILYNAQGKVINFDSYDEFFLEDVVGDDTLDFDVCVDPLNQEVARYELRAWGK